MKLFILLLSISAAAFADEKRNESFYQNAWCGESPAQLSDGTFVDCVKGAYAIEIDFAHKFKEAIGQSIHYARVTGLTPGIALIIRKDSDWRYVAATEADLRYMGLNAVKVYVIKDSNYR